MKHISPLLLTLLCVPWLSGCYVYSAFQGARVVQPGRIAVTPSLSLLSFGEDGESTAASTNYGAHAAIGLTDRLNLTGRYERVEWANSAGSSDSHNYLDLGFKYAVVPDVLAFAMPIGFFYGEGVEEDESLQIHPALHLTVPVMQQLDLNATAKYLHFFDDPSENLTAVMFGLGVRVIPERLTVFPELGYLFNLGEDGHYFHWGVGLGVEF
jgi:hypothetical protein